MDRENPSISEKQIEMIKKRKKEGIDIPLKEKVQGKETTTLLEDVYLIHNALPEINIEDIKLDTVFLGRSLFCSHYH